MWKRSSKPNSSFRINCESAPVQKGDVGDGKIALTSEDLNDLTGQEGTPLKHL